MHTRARSGGESWCLIGPDTGGVTARWSARLGVPGIVSATAAAGGSARVPARPTRSASLPMDATLATPSIMVTPAYRSGALVRFPVSRGDSAVLRFLRPDGTPAPAGGEVLIRGVSFPVALGQADARRQPQPVTRRVADAHAARCGHPFVAARELRLREHQPRP